MNFQKDIPRLSAPSPLWLAQFKVLMKDSWLKEKVNRTRRLEEQWIYLRDLDPTLADRPRGLVVDLGCGPGELLEIARYFKHDILGVDAVDGQGGMGDQYLRASRLLRERQQIPCYASDFWGWVRDVENFTGTATLINSRGSWEQMFSAYMVGEPHHVHHDANRLTWDYSPKLQEATVKAIKAIHQALRKDGLFIVHFNGAKNHLQYRRFFNTVAESTGLKSLPSSSEYISRWAAR